MGCHYPAYMSFDYDDNLPCSDKSDQIHKSGTNCTIDQHLDIYKSLFCNDSNTEVLREEGRCQTIQNDPTGWISILLGLGDKLKDKSNKNLNEKYDEKRKELEGILDPHNCQASCQTPDYGCEACTNSAYFNCPVNGEPHCLHPDLECDGHPQCDNAEDEDFWKCLSWSSLSMFFSR